MTPPLPGWSHFLETQCLGSRGLHHKAKSSKRTKMFNIVFSDLKPVEVGAAKENVEAVDGEGSKLGLILGIVVPIALLLIIVPIVTVFAYKR